MSISHQLNLCNPRYLLSEIFESALDNYMSGKYNEGVMISGLFQFIATANDIKFKFQALNRKAQKEALLDLDLSKFELSYLLSFKKMDELETDLRFYIQNYVLQNFNSEPSKDVLDIILESDLIHSISSNYFEYHFHRFFETIQNEGLINSEKESPKIEKIHFNLNQTQLGALFSVLITNGYINTPSNPKKNGDSDINYSQMAKIIASHCTVFDGKEQRNINAIHFSKVINPGGGKYPEDLTKKLKLLHRDELQNR